MKRPAQNFFLVPVACAAVGLLNGCTCTVVETHEVPGGGDSETVCHAVEVDPASGSDGVDARTPVLRARFNAPLDPATAVAAVRLVRIEDGAEMPIDVQLAEADTLEVTPISSLRYWSSYELAIEPALQTADGDSCLGESLVFSTSEPLVEEAPLRPAPVSAAVAVDEKVFVASSSMPGLQVYDFSVAATPTLVSSIPTAAVPQGIRHSGNTLYVPMGSDGVWIFDVSDPNGPELVAVVGTPGTALDAVPIEQADRTYLAIADGAAGLMLTDITSPEAPVTKYTLHYGSAVSAQRLSADADRLVIALGGEGFSVLDIEAIEAPVEILRRKSEALPETFAAALPVREVLIDGDVIFVALGTTGFQTFLLEADAATFVDYVGGPNSACQVSCWDTLGALSVNGDSLLATGRLSGGLRMTHLGGGTLGELERLPTAAHAKTIGTLGDALLLGTDAGFEVRDALSGGEMPPLYVEAEGWGVVRAVAGQDGAIYAASHSRGLLTLDATLNSFAVLPSSGPLTDVGASSVTLNDSTLLLGDGRSGFSTFDVSRPASPELLTTVTGEFDLIGSVAFSGPIAFVCDGNRALRAFDTTDPSAPVEIGALVINNIVGGCVDIVVRDALLYVAGTNGLGVVDATDPASLSLTTAFTLPGRESLSGLALYSDTLFASTSRADWEAGTDAVSKRLVAFDVAEAMSPQLIYASDDLGLNGGLLVHGDKLFATASFRGVAVFDLAFPSEPALEGVVDVPVSAQGLHSEGNIVYVAGGGGGIVRVIAGELE